MPDVREAELHTDNKKYIETAFGVLCNMPLLGNHSASWEILVSKRHISDYNTEGNLTAHIPVIQIYTFSKIPKFQQLAQFANQTHFTDHHKLFVVFVSGTF